jgi:hypothetical protein
LPSLSTGGSFSYMPRKLLLIIIFTRMLPSQACLTVLKALARVVESTTIKMIDAVE